MEKNLTYTEMSARLHFYESHNIYQRKQLDEKEEEIKELKAELERVKELLKLALKEKYAPKSEKADIDNGQLSFYEYEETPTETVPVQIVKAYTRKEKRTYEEIYKNLPVSEIVYDLSEEEKYCNSCGKEMTFMGYDSYREIEYTPPEIKIIEHRKKKYVCKSCETIRTAKAPLPLFDHSLVSPSLLSYIINEKFCKGVPLYRLEQDLHRMGINISRQSMCSWIIAGAELLKPIYDILHKRLVEEEILHADETPFQVNKVKGRTKPVHGYMWVYRTGKYAEVPIIMYDYRNGRAGDYPVQFLKGFSGYLHCDGLRQYSYIPHVTRAGCWVHLRRYFLNAVNVQHNKNDLTTLAGQGFLRIQKIFRVEGRNSENSQKNYSYSLKEIAYIRKTKSSSLASEFFEWCEKNQGIAAPGSITGKAISYSLGQKEYLMNVFVDPRLELTNNAAERGVRPIVVGRKNWLFAHSERGAEAAAIIYSIVETAKAANIKIFDYFCYIFDALRNCSFKNLDELLPWAGGAKFSLSVGGGF